MTKFLSLVSVSLICENSVAELHRSNGLFDLIVCIFFARQMESDMSIYFMPPRDRSFKDKQSKSPFVFGLS